METTCVSCGAKLPAGATFCTSCGTKQPAQQATPPPAQQPAGGAKCVSCGAPLPPGGTFCSSCGTRQPPPQQPAAPAAGAPQYGPPAAGAPQYGPPPAAAQYGAPPYGAGPFYDPKREEAQRYNTYGLICGVLGLFIFGIILGPLALYFGGKARSLDSNQGTAGIVLGIIDIILWAFVLILVLIPILIFL